jgi:hypothetical protein
MRESGSGDTCLTNNYHVGRREVCNSRWLRQPELELEWIRSIRHAPDFAPRIPACAQSFREVLFVKRHLQFDAWHGSIPAAATPPANLESMSHARSMLNTLVADGEAHGSAAGNSRRHSWIGSGCPRAPSTGTLAAVSNHRTTLSAPARALGNLWANLAPPCSARIRRLFEVWAPRVWISARAMRWMPCGEVRRI